MIKSFALATTLLAFTAATPAVAEDTNRIPVTVSVIGHAVAMTDNSLNPEQIDTLVGLAFQSAVARTCPGFAIDLAKFEAEFNTLEIVPRSEEFEVDDGLARYHERAVMTAFGVATGAFLADFAQKPFVFCEDANIYRSEAGDDTIFAAE